VRIATLALLVSLTGSGCASLSGSKDQYFVCSFDTAWEAALESVKDRPVQSQDRDKGVIETGWVEMEGKERSYGAFGREGFGNRERARMTIAVKPMNDVVSVSVLESRQRWHMKGGVTQQSTKWWPVDPSEEAEVAVVTRLNNKLKEKGCQST
jgi:NlpB/DapX lipoprotein